MDNNIDFNEIIAKHFSDNTSPNETRKLLNWINNNQENLDTFRQYFEIWIANQSFSQENDQIKTKIWENIIGNITDLEKAYTTPKEKKYIKTLLVLKRVAATIAIIIALGISYLYFTDTKIAFDKLEYSNSDVIPSKGGYIMLSDQLVFALPSEEITVKYTKNFIKVITKDNDEFQTINRNISKTFGNNTHQLQVPKGIVYNLIMDDKSSITLNSNSTYIYRPKSISNKRKAILLGEGYFKITNNKQKPFHLTAGEIVIEVLGTDFNVLAYSDDDYIETTLISGSIRLKSNQKSAPFSPIILKPNEKAIFSKKNNKLHVNKNIDSENSISWTSNYFKFESESIDKVLNKIAKNYGYKLKITTKEFDRFLYSGKLEKLDSIEEILDGLKLSAPITYSIDNQTITLEFHKEIN